MTCVFEVSPFDRGWCVKLCDTGEVLFFETGGQAEREARRLAATHPGGARVRVLDLRRQLAGEWSASVSPTAEPGVSTSEDPLAAPTLDDLARVVRRYPPG
ncbi:hypothetical protein [Caulobacter sp.]|uniref:hypothetical protein n=1 Tax=Caulobacter sp. TaxID=78 RepID=UPI002B46AEF7|nr:hypothetical protein [Caulobacter sp.]HJV40538.1 hypothetical protein [Caulobacter sp.]